MHRTALFALALLTACPKPAPTEAAAETEATAPGQESAAHALDAVLGDWRGELAVPGGGLRLALHVSEGADGLQATLDSPDQGAMGMPASAVSFDGHTLIVTHAMLDAVIELVPEQGALDGSFTQRGMSLPLTLEPGSFDPPTRPQEPTPPLPYAEEEVRIEVGDTHTLAGTLTLPEGEGPFPAVLLITGSGPQDRDEAIMGHRPFYVLADRLTRAGIAVLRTDDRGVGESTGDFGAATTRDFAVDAAAAATWLDARTETGAVGLLGHSEGGLVAPLVAGEVEADFLVLLAPPAVPIVELMLRQQEDVAMAMGVPEAQATARREERRALLEAVAQGDEAAVREAVAAAPESAGLDAATLDAAVAPLLTPWWREFAGYDPEPALEALAVPTLALWGERDTQVAAEPNLAAMQAAVDETLLTAAIEPGLNHLFQPAQTGSPTEYATIETTLSEEVMARIAAFVVGKASGDR